MVGKLDGADGQQELDDFNLLLRSAASRTAGPILAAGLHAKFVRPLALLIGTPDAELRASLLTSATLGFATIRIAFGAEAFIHGDPRKVVERLTRIFQACLEP